MNALPVIERELICEARNSTNYWLRLASAGALMGLGLLYVVRGGGTDRDQGTYLFHEMTQTLQLTMFVLVPIMASDSISREKREGTLGLLFLTPLRAREIVLGKCLTHLLRAGTLLLATVPVLCLPLMMGGVDIRAAFHAVASVTSALAIALAVSIHASVRNFEAPLAIGHGLALSALFSLPFWTCLNIPLIAGSSAFVFLPFAGAAAYLSIERSSTHLAMNWRREIATPTRSPIIEAFADSETWQRIFRWNRPRALDRNPIAWLQEYSWQRRLTKWVWFIIMFVLAPAGGCIVGRFMDYTTWLSILTLTLAAGAAFTATSTFRNELDSLELLLVTPLTVGQIVHGRLWGVFAHFFPALMILMFYWVTPSLFDSVDGGRHWIQHVFSLSTLITIPLIGFWLALKRLHLVAAWLISLLLGYGVPIYLVVVVIGSAGGGPTARVAATLLFVLCQSALAVVSYGKVRATITKRTFAKA